MVKNKGKFALAVMLVLILAFTMQFVASTEVLKVGSSVENVKALQSKLKRRGYYNGVVDGHFGQKTKAAVIFFQQKKRACCRRKCGQHNSKSTWHVHRWFIRLIIGFIIKRLIKQRCIGKPVSACTLGLQRLHQYARW